MPDARVQHCPNVDAYNFHIILRSVRLTAPIPLHCCYIWTGVVGRVAGMTGVDDLHDFYDAQEDVFEHEISVVDALVNLPDAFDAAFSDATYEDAAAADAAAGPDQAGLPPSEAAGLDGQRDFTRQASMPPPSTPGSHARHPDLADQYDKVRPPDGWLPQATMTAWLSKSFCMHACRMDTLLNWLMHATWAENSCFFTRGFCTPAVACGALPGAWHAYAADPSQKLMHPPAWCAVRSSTSGTLTSGCG